MSDYKLTMPWPPSVNGYWRSFKGRQIISKRGREYRADVVALMKDAGLHGELLSGRISVKITLEPPTLRKYDIDNFCKGVFDGLSHAKFWVDDEQVDKLTIEKAEKKKGGSVILEINILED
jgi:crossover junction endodeoxyribonuclease RusA